MKKKQQHFDKIRNKKTKTYFKTKYNVLCSHIVSAILNEQKYSKNFQISKILTLFFFQFFLIVFGLILIVFSK